MPTREKGTEERLDNSVGDDSDSDVVMTGESTADGAGSGTERRVKVLTLAEARDATETWCLFYKTRIPHRPSDAKHSLYLPCREGPGEAVQCLINCRRNDSRSSGSPPVYFAGPRKSVMANKGGGWGSGRRSMT